MGKRVELATEKIIVFRFVHFNIYVSKTVYVLRSPQIPGKIIHKSISNKKYEI